MREKLFRSNKELIEILCDKENIPVLEHIIERDGNEFVRLKQLKEKGEINFGKKVKKREFKDICLEVKEEVDELLDTHNARLPKTKQYGFLSNKLTNSLIVLAGMSLTLGSFYPSPFLIYYAKKNWHKGNHTHYNLSYSPYNSSIRIIKKNKIHTTITFAHEYTHYLQDSEMGKWDLTKYEILYEGHARGVERMIADLHSNKEKNENYRYFYHYSHFEELKDAYWFMCDKLKIKTNQSLLKIGKDYNFKKKKVIYNNFHELGNALFYIYEELHSKDIYRQLLHP